MSARSRLRGLLSVGLLILMSSAFPVIASADSPAEAAAAQQPTPPVRSLRVLGGSTRFTAPVRDIPALRRTMSRANIQRDIGTVLDEAGLTPLTFEVRKILADGAVMETTLATGTSLEWMALRRGRPRIVRNVRWDGARPLEGFQFTIDNLVETYTFFVPEICGNLSLVSREPSREKARRDEEARLKAEEARRAEAARAAELAKAEADRKATEARLAEEARKAAEARKAEEARLAEQARKDEEARKAEAARAAEAARLAAEESALDIRPFIAGYFGKQQRQYDETDPAELGFTRSDNTVSAFGNPLVGLEGGVAFRITDHWTFNPSIGVGINTDEGSRTSLFGDAEIAYVFSRGPYVGTGLTLWDWTHSDSFTFGWLGTAGVPVWKSDAKKHQLDLSVEWRQFFDRMSDPDVNYQFWGGLRYLFK